MLEKEQNQPVALKSDFQCPRRTPSVERVYINGAQYFDGVPKEVWEFQFGGYQVCEKWLKDRKGRKLSSDDIDHYQKIVVALAETIRLMPACRRRARNRRNHPRLAPAVG